MKSRKSGMIHCQEFECEAPLRFYEHCSSCVRFGDDCPDLALGKEILQGKKKLVYTQDHLEGLVHASEFNCLTPLYYFEQSRSKCAHQGRCREEGLLLALLSGKKDLIFAQKDVIEFPVSKARRRGVVAREDTAKEVIT